MPWRGRAAAWSALPAALLIGAVACARLPAPPVPDVQAAAVAPPKADAVSAPIPAPVAERRPQAVVSPNGVRDDPYYWLRDDTRSAAPVLTYLAAENAYRDALLAPLRATEELLYGEIVAHLPPEDSTPPVLDHGWWRSKRYEAGQEYPVYVGRRNRPDAAEQVLLDGNALAAGSPYYEIGEIALSPDGRYLAWTEDRVGRRQYQLHVKDLRHGAVLPDQVADIETQLVWANDSRTLLYIEKNPVTLLGERVRRHRLGSTAQRDPLVYEEKDHSYYLSLLRSKSERFLFIGLTATDTTEWRFADANDPALHFRTVLPRQRGHDYQVESNGRAFVLRTNWKAPNFRIVSAPLAAVRDPAHWTTLLPERADAFPDSYEVFEHAVVVNERQGGQLGLHVHSFDGRQDYRIEAGQPAAAETLVPTPGAHSHTVRYELNSLVTPKAVLAFDLDTRQRESLKTEAVGGGFDAADYRSELIMATARDGSAVPVSIAYRKDTRLDGSAPLWQYGYGAYGWSTDPEFHPAWLSLLDRGFVVAIAHVRGGAELGRRWYEGGRQLHKRNTFTDFIDVTRFLVAHGYAAKDKVFAEGASAGGLLMAAVATLAPSEYRGIVAGVPFVDVVTTMLDESIPLTSNEFDEWGDPRRKADYDYLLSYSPYDNVGAQAYPALYVTTGLWDSQVQYYEPTKWVAKLRAAKTDTHPLILSIDMSAGHGGQPGRKEQYREIARQYAFALDQLGQPR